MEVHHGKSKIHSFRDFVLEVSMIVLGVLIALGVEQTREHFREKNLVRDTREVFRNEMDLDRRILAFYFDHTQAPKESMQRFLAAEEAGKRDLPAYQEPIWQYVITGAWDTAVATQALSYMPADEVRRYSTVHASQVVFNQFSAQMQPVLFELNAFHGRKNLSAGERAERDSRIRLVLNYLQALDQSGHELLDSIDQIMKAAGS